MRLHGPNRACETCGKVLRLDATHPTCVACRRATGWRGQTREAVRKANAKRAPKNRADAKAWRLANPEKYKAKKRMNEAIRRARKRGALVERVVPAVVLERDGEICHICHWMVDPDDWHMDHVVPLARGGDHSYANIKTAHPRCNVLKGVR